MSHRVNVVIDDEVWTILENVPKGERSRAVNAALLEWSTRRRRRAAVEAMDRRRATLPSVDDEALVRWVREDRERAIDDRTDGDGTHR